jgi:hypothetical protein
MGAASSFLFSLLGIGSPPATFITFTSYWGFSNQLQELKVAANWARYTGRTLVLPRWAHSRDPQSLEPETCTSLNHLCEPLARLVDVPRLREFIDVEIAQEHHAQNDSKFVVEFGVDFRTKENRMKYLVRWMSDEPGMLVQDSYFRTKSTPPGAPPMWCHSGLLVSPYRCMRSAHELSRRTETTIHFPRFSTFQVGKLWSGNAGRRAELNAAVDGFVRPSRSVFRIADRVLAELELMRRGYDAIHVRRGDFLNTSWARVGDLSDRGKALFDTVSNGPASASSKASRVIVFVATDDEEYIEREGRERLKAAGYRHVVTWPKRFHNSVSPLSRSLTEQLICARARVFAAQKGSTWSTYVEMLRSRPELLQDARGRDDDL